MSRELIQVYEHESLNVDRLGEANLEMLSRFIGDRDAESLPYSLINKGVKFKSFVGVLCVGDLQIEVLPKADKRAGESDKKQWEGFLLEMLRSVYKLDVKLPSAAEQNIRRSPVLDVFLHRFLNDVERLLREGLVKTYRRVEDNRTSLKGRLLIHKHVVKNAAHMERFYVDYSTYDYNHILNRILFKALKVILDISSSCNIYYRTKSILLDFPELNDIAVSESLFNRIEYNRKTDTYRESIELAKLILLNYMPDLSYKKGNAVLSMMFDMNKLWEEYVFVTLRRQLANYQVTAQNRKGFWANKIIKPDIVVSDKGRCVAVLDTKWKCPKDGTPSDSDLKQMYVYHKYWNTMHSALVYPGDSPTVRGLFKDKEECCMFFLPIKMTDSSCFLETSELLKYVEDEC